MQFRGCLIFLYYFLFEVQGSLHHVSYFENLNYDSSILASHHDKAKRSLAETGSKPPIHLKFNAFDQEFNLRISHDKSVFHKDFVLEDSSGAPISHNLNHLYAGVLYGVPESVVHGTIIDGIFRGHIYHPTKGNYYIEENHLFHGLSTGVTPILGYRGHSVIYHQNDVKHPNRYATPHTCGSSDHGVHERMENIQTSFEKNRTRSRHYRMKRSIDETKTHCLLYIQTDWVLFKDFSGLTNTRELVISKIAEHVKVVNQYYHRTDFEGIKGIGFIVKRLRVNETQENSGPYFRHEKVGVETFLNYASARNYDKYCLAYVFTTRDFENGVLGLAWIADPARKNGGICERYQTLSSGKLSLNTGIVTFKNYGRMMPSAVSHITFAHEIGHNFGSPHDSGSLCSPGDYSTGNRGDGNYIMYAKATNGEQPNNVLFSPCSIGNISQVLRMRKDVCFKASTTIICGNGIVEKGEECDCGYEDDCKQANDTCCSPGGSSTPCKLLPGKQCSPSQGPCCHGNTCRFQPSGHMCAEATECRQKSTCNGSSSSCHTGPAKPDTPPIECAYKTKLCKEGECSASRCEINRDYEACECRVPKDAKDREVLCHTCCQRKDGNGSDCVSIGSESLKSIFHGDVIYLQPGSPCDNNNGYCDVFSKCRSVDAEGPLSRMKDAIFNPQLYNTIRKWIVTYWWAVALMVLALLLLMIGFVKLCSVHTPTSNPQLPKHRQLPGAETLRRRRNRHNQSAQSTRMQMQRR